MAVWTSSVNSSFFLPFSIWLITAYSQVCLELSLLVVALESECTKQVCPEMKADGWMYLCAAHPSTQSVSLFLFIESYFNHNNSLANIKYSVQPLITSFTLWMELRFCWIITSIFQAGKIYCVIHGWVGIYILTLLYYRISIPEPSLKHFQSVARRLYRIFAHAYFHHREVYEYFEVRIYKGIIIIVYSYIYIYILYRMIHISMQDFCYYQGLMDLFLLI